MFLFITQIGQTMGKANDVGEHSIEFESKENRDSKIGSVAVGCDLKLFDGGVLDELLSTVQEISGPT